MGSQGEPGGSRRTPQDQGEAMHMAAYENSWAQRLTTKASKELSKDLGPLITRSPLGPPLRAPKIT